MAAGRATLAALPTAGAAALRMGAEALLAAALRAGDLLGAELRGAPATARAVLIP
jgi:hypothetical protein